MQMNDAHIYCAEEQFEAEFMGVIDLYRKYFELFQVDRYVMRLSTHHPKGWARSTWTTNASGSRRRRWCRAMVNGGVPFVEVPDEAAPTAPRSTCRSGAPSAASLRWPRTNADFAQFTPDLTFIISREARGRDAALHPPCAVEHPRTHDRLPDRALRRRAPVWLAPEQARVIPITDAHNEYALRLAAQLQDAGVRAAADLGADRMNAKIRAAQMMTVPYMLVVGDREVEEETVALRKRDGSRQNGMPFGEFQALVQERIRDRSPEL
ncbi:MAG: His/Gly/Thr/Pro-type tRNA ligase C-terminal domain-containing protein [Caldilineaceae bacterium]